MKPVTKPTSSAKLRIDQLWKVFPSPEDGADFIALQNISLDVPAGEFVCLLGPSGCGKTTLLNTVAGFLEPSSGTLELDEQPIVGAGSDRGVVFQDYALFPWLTVRKNVQFGPRVHGLSSSDQEAISTKYLDLVGLREFENRYPHQLSGGMKQRVAIARALANRPSVLLMDEPFGALDAMTRETMQEELRALTSIEPKLVIFVTHSVPEAVFLADRIVVMGAKPGRVVADIRVPLPHPRDRLAPEVTSYVREIRALITAPPAARKNALLDRDAHIPADAEIER